LMILAINSDPFNEMFAMPWHTQGTIATAVRASEKQ